MWNISGMKVRHVIGLWAVFQLFLASSVFAAESDGNRTYPLPDTLEDTEMLIVTVDLEPGQASPPHRHNAHVFVYVLEGTVEMQVRGGPLMQLGPGEMFHETPADIHQVSRNASDSEPAKFLVHILKKKGAPVTVPAE